MSIKSVTKRFEERLYGSKKFFKLYSYPYKGVVRRELRLAQVDENDEVLNVGCGAQPFTAVYIAKISGAKVLAMDKDEKALKAADKIIDSLNLGHQIDLIRADASDMVPGSYDEAFVALQVSPKDEVINNLLKDSGSEIVVRKPRERFEESYDTLSDNFHVKKHTKHNLPTFDKSLLISK